LVKCNEILGATLLSQHNLWFYQDLMRGIRESIENGRFQQFKEDFIKEYTKGNKDERK
jgi:queuine tRNA-ribosyltransferase